MARLCSMGARDRRRAGGRRCGQTASVMVLTSAILAACSGAPIPTGSSAAATPTAGLQAFTSLYGYQVLLPPRWRVRPATTIGFSGTMEGGCANTGWDCFEGPDRRNLNVAATDVAATTALQDWKVQLDATTPPFCTDSGTPEATTLDGEAAIAWTAVCMDEGLDVINVATIHEARGYFLFMTSSTINGLASDRETLDSILATFRFNGMAS
jgi:hypothetical protein